MGTNWRYRLLGVVAVVVGLAPIACVAVAFVGFATGGPAREHTQLVASLTLAGVVAMLSALGGAVAVSARDANG